MGQRQLFDKARETHGYDPEQRPTAFNVLRNTFRSWCGKTLPGDRFAVNGTEPTCYQCKLIWQKMKTPT